MNDVTGQRRAVDLISDAVILSRMRQPAAAFRGVLVCSGPRLAPTAHWIETGN